MNILMLGASCSFSVKSIETILKSFLSSYAVLVLELGNLSFFGYIVIPHCRELTHTFEVQQSDLIVKMVCVFT